MPFSGSARGGGLAGGVISSASSLIYSYKPSEIALHLTAKNHRSQSSSDLRMSCFPATVSILGVLDARFGATRAYFRVRRLVDKDLDRCYRSMNLRG